MDSNLLHSLLAHTGNLRPTHGSSNAELHDLRRAIAASLRGGQVDAEIGTAASPQIVSASVREDLEYLAAQAPDLSQRIRVARRERGAGGMQTAEWAAGMVAAQTLGPFLDDFGRPLWFDLFLLPQVFRVLRGNEPLLVLPIGTSKNPNEPLLVVPAGTVWIRGNQLTSGVPANAWVGMRVKGGTIRIPQGSTLTDNELTIHVAALLNLRIELDPPALAGPASGPGSEATHAQATLPAEAAFAFGPLGVESIETGPASLSVYGNDITLTRNVSHVVFEPILRMVLIPMDADRDSLEVGSVHSTLFAPRGAATIEMAAWGISVTMTAPENLGSAAGAGSLVLATESGRLGSWPGLLEGEAVLGETLLAVDHSTLTLLARSATHFHGQQVFELWEESSGAPSMIEVQFLRPFLLVLVSSRHGSDSLVFGAQLLGHLDRPLRVDGSRFPIDLHGSLVCLETASETRLGIEASTQPAGFLPMAIALSNALVTITRPTRLFVHGTLEAGVRVDKATLVLESNVYQVLPTLPDPYAANFEPLLTQDAPVGGASLRATVTWPDAQHPALEILLDTPDGVQQLLPQPNRLARDPFDPRGVASGSLYWLLDVSSGADQLGLSLSIPTGAEAPPEARRLEIGNFSLQFPGNQMYTMLLPQFQWEAVYNTRNSRTGDQDGWLQPSVEGVGPSDGGPSFVRSQTAQLIPLAPTPVAVEMVRAYTHDNAPSGAVLSPPTKLQTFFFGIVITWIWVDPKHDIDVVPGHFHPLDQCPDEIALARPIGGFQAVVEFGRKVLQPANNQLQFPLQSGLIGQRLALLLHAGEALAQASHPGLKLSFVDEALRVTINQSGDALAQLADLAFDGSQRRPCGTRLGPQTASIFLGEPLWVGQQGTHFLPHRQVQQISPHLRMLTDAFAPKAIGIRPQTAVIGIGVRFAFAGARAQAFPVEGIATVLALEQTLQQIEGAPARLPRMALVLLQLLLDGREDLGRHQRWDGNRHPLLGRDSTAGHGAARRHGPVTLRAQPWAPGAQARLAKRRGALIGWVLQEAPHHTPIPHRLAGAGHLAGLGQPATDLANRQAVVTDPGKDLAHHAGLGRDDLIAGLPTSLVLGHIAIPIGGPAEHIDRTALGRMALAPPLPLDDLGPFILGNHPLHLQQQVVFRTLPQGPIEEDDLDTRATKFIDQQDLIGIFAGQAIRRVDREPVDAPRRDHIAQALQRRAHQRGPTLPFVQTLHGLGYGQPIGRHALAQGGHLTGNGMRLGVRLRRYTCV